MEQLRIVVAGQAGSGKRTLIRQLLHETGSLPKEISDNIGKSQESNCKEDFADAVEHLAKNSDVDTAQIEFRTSTRNYSFIIPQDYTEFLKNTVTGTIKADAAILVVDFSKELHKETYLYSYLLSMFDVKEIIVVINKMDLTLYNETKFLHLSEEITTFLQNINIRIVSIIPALVSYGESIMVKSDRLHRNTSVSLMESLGYLSAPKNMTHFPLRLIVQSVYLTNAKTKILAKVVSGKLSVGCHLTFGPKHRTANVLSIEVDNQPRASATADEIVALILEDINYLERGQVGFNSDHSPLPLTTDFLTTEVFWMADNPLLSNDRIDILCGTRYCSGRIEKISDISGPTCPDVEYNSVDKLAKSQIANIRIKLDSPICIDPFDRLPYLGRFAIFQDEKIAGGGIFKDTNKI